MSRLTKALRSAGRAVSRVVAAPFQAIRNVSFDAMSKAMEALTPKMPDLTIPTTAPDPSAAPQQTPQFTTAPSPEEIAAQRAAAARKRTAGTAGLRIPLGGAVNSATGLGIPQ